MSMPHKLASAVAVVACVSSMLFPLQASADIVTEVITGTISQWRFPDQPGVTGSNWGDGMDNAGYFGTPGNLQGQPSL